MRTKFKLKYNSCRERSGPFLVFIILIMAAPLIAAPRFTDNGNGTVSDAGTILVWQKCSRGQNNDASCTGSATIATWAASLTYCNGLTLAGRTWHLPNVNELQSIADMTIGNPSINTTFFPATVADGYWSSSAYVLNPIYAGYVYFYDGSVFANVKTTTYYVRCVSPGP